MYITATHVGHLGTLAALVVLGLSSGAGATIVLEADRETPGTPIVLSDNVLLGAPATLTLRTTGGGSPGADIYIDGSTNDDFFNTTTLFLDAGAGGNIRLAGPVGDTAAVAALVVTSANAATLPPVTTAGGGGVNVNANAINLNGNVATAGAAITLQGNVTLGAAAAITLDTTTGAPAGGNITITGTVNDDAANTSGLLLKGGTNGNINLQGAVGGGTPIASLTINSANQVSLPAVTTAGAVSVTATTLTLGGAMSAGGNVALNAGTVNLNNKVTAVGVLTGTAGTVNLSMSGSLQNAFDIAASGALLNVAGGDYAESATAGTACTVKFSGNTSLGGTLTASGAIALGGEAKSLAVDALSIGESGSLDLNDIYLYVDGNVELTLGDWISDGRLFSTAWGSLIDASYDSSLDRTAVTPEPATLALLALGGLVALRRRIR